MELWLCFLYLHDEYGHVIARVPVIFILLVFVQPCQVYQAPLLPNKSVDSYETLQSFLRLCLYQHFVKCSLQHWSVRLHVPNQTCEGTDNGVARPSD